MSDTSENEIPPEEPTPAEGDGGTTTDAPAEEPTTDGADGGTTPTGEASTDGGSTTDGTTTGGSTTDGGESTTDPTQPENEVPNPLPEGEDAGAGAVQSALEQEQEQGFRGEPADDTPNHAYTVAGVLANEETPESRLSTPQ